MLSTPSTAWIVTMPVRRSPRTSPTAMAGGPTLTTRPLAIAVAAPSGLTALRTVTPIATRTARRTALAEDSFLVREALTHLLEDADEVELVAVCEDADALRAAIETRELDLVITDIRLPPSHSDEGIRLAGELRHSHPDLGVIVL